MFIPMLTPEQQEALCRIVRFVANVDDDNPYRGDVLALKLQQESILTEIPPAAANLDEVKGYLPIFNTPLSARALVLESLGVALADQVVHPDELKAIEAIAQGLGLDSAWTERARDYVQRAIEIQREGQEILTS